MNISSTQTVPAKTGNHTKMPVISKFAEHVTLRKTHGRSMDIFNNSIILILSEEEDAQTMIKNVLNDEGNMEDILNEEAKEPEKTTEPSKGVARKHPRTKSRTRSSTPY